MSAEGLLLRNFSSRPSQPRLRGIMPQALGCKQSRPTPEENEAGVPSDIANSSRALASFWRWWDCSRLRLLAEEICNLPHRIQTTLARSHLRFGYSLPLYPTFDGRESGGQGYAFLCACSEDTKKLRQDNPWAGCLDLELAGAAYQAGAQWAILSFRKGQANNCSESLSSDQFSKVPDAGADASSDSANGH